MTFPPPAARFIRGAASAWSETMVEDTCPEWKHSIDIATFEWLSMSVVKITHHWEYTSADTSRDWIVLHTKSSKREFPSNFLNANGYFEFKPNYCELVQPTWRADQARKDLAAIRAWNRKNAAEIATYERLKAKFAVAEQNGDLQPDMQTRQIS